MSDIFRPIVGIPCRYNWNTNYYEVRETYPEAIYAAGGTPVMLPLIPEPDYVNAIMEKIDALCLSGSINDIDPLRYGQEPKPKLGPVVPKRDETDALLIEYAEAHDLPILAICFGIQSLNVYRGGTLIQDVESEVTGSLKHMQGDLFYRRSHSINITEGSLLAELAASNRALVNSHHHQAIDIVGRNLEPIAWAADGVIEAVIDTRRERSVLGVQWHPEVGWQSDELSQAIFAWFIEKSRQRHFSRDDEMATALR
ncbi:MAG: gamma-glutamyl-gamma-aminobutyrate hydrolase family protein [Acidobacteria bacterium]|nr:gamma-glutamyl-gamma-aminobutyrate hydrolase family protein [Acidobacteriota bacterium]